jgi:polyisoprenoid-binding protein YceI
MRSRKGWERRGRAAPGVALALLAGCAAAPPRAVDLAALPPALPPSDAVEQYPLSEDNTEVEAEATAFGEYTLRFTRVSGRLDLQPSALAGSSVDVVVDTRSLEAVPLVEGVARSASFLDVERFPEARFTSRRLVPVEGPRYRLLGELTLHGVRRAVAVPAEVEVNACAVRVRSVFSVDRRDYEIRGDGPLAGIIGDEVVLRIEARLPRKGAPPRCRAGR